VEAGIDPIKVARRLWKGDARNGTAAVATTGITSAAWRCRILPKEHSAKTQAETPLQDLPG